MIRKIFLSPIMVNIYIFLMYFIQLRTFGVSLHTHILFALEETFSFSYSKKIGKSCFLIDWMKRLLSSSLFTFHKLCIHAHTFTLACGSEWDGKKKEAEKCSYHPSKAKLSTLFEILYGLPYSLHFQKHS